MIRTSAVAVLALLAATAAPTAAGAQTTVDPRGASLSNSASCAQGDIEIDYIAGGVERQITDFTAEDGRVLHHYDVEVYSPDHEAIEYILSQTTEPPPAGSIVAVHVTVGHSPPSASTGEFFVAYRCDTLTNKQGGNNEVITSCAGMFGACPVSASNLEAPPAATEAPPAPTSAAETPPGPRGACSAGRVPTWCGWRCSRWRPSRSAPCSASASASAGPDQPE